MLGIWWSATLPRPAKREVLGDPPYGQLRPWKLVNVDLGIRRVDSGALLLSALEPEHDAAARLP